MMNKLLMTASAFALVGAMSGQAMGDGFNTFVKLGYSGTKAKGKTSTAGTNRGTAADKIGNGFLAGLGVGYWNTLSNKLMLGVSLGFNYDTGKARVANQTRPTEGKVTFEPKSNIDLTLKVGRMFNEKMAGYLGLGHEFGYGRYKFASVKDNVRTFSLVPHLGVMGKLHEKVSWLGEVGYKFATNLSGLSPNHKALTDKKPHGFQAKVGVSYHF
tara:strand:- start:42609 stop:43250 length:642 start_codon:yes stop_codon:yes gene_type:complete